MKGREVREKQPRVNFRLLLFCALGLSFGIFLYGRLRYGGFRISDLLFAPLLTLFALPPLSKKRVIAIACCFLVFAGAGALSLLCYGARFEDRPSAGRHEVLGTATDVTVGNGYSVVTLSRLSVDGERQGGRLRVFLQTEEARTGDVWFLTADLTPVEEGERFEYDFSSDFRCEATVSEFRLAGRSSDPLLILRATLCDRLHENMGKDEADVAYALLTGSGGMDEGLAESVRRGGVAHIFAVSGLHIGILFSAVYLLMKPLKQFRFLPALALALLYSAFCGFSVSSVRAVVMCGVFGGHAALGKKYDFLQSVSFAAILILLFSPAQWFSAGFRLSFGACLGLALFGGSFTRLFGKLHFPRLLAQYLGACLSVQLFSFPILMQTFGYCSVWGLLLNPVLVPLLSPLFLGLMLLSLLSLILPPLAGFFLTAPGEAISLFILFFSTADLSFVLTGFSLGAAFTVWYFLLLVLTQRVRLSAKARGIAAGFLCVLFAGVLAYENLPLGGCKIIADDGKALVLCQREAVLVVDEGVSLDDCESFLSRHYGGKLDAVAVLGENVNAAAFLNAEEVRLMRETETGLREKTLLFGESFSYGELVFRYESGNKLMLTAEGIAVEFDFKGSEALGADLFIGAESAVYYLGRGKITTR